MQPYKYATFGLIVAMVAVTFPQWSELDFAPGDDMPTTAEIPESWDMNVHEYSYQGLAYTDVRYDYHDRYYDCLLQVDKRGTSLLLELDCETQFREGYGPSTFTNGTVISPALEDFEMAWPDRDHCGLTLSRTVYPDRENHDGHVSALMYC